MLNDILFVAQSINWCSRGFKHKELSTGDAEMALQSLSDGLIDSVPERSQNLHSSWFAVAGVVYSWTDRREAAVDKAWWQNQAPRFYKQEPTVPDEARIGEAVAPSECLVPSQLLQPDLSEAKELLAELASRSSCRGHTFLSDRSSEEDETTEVL